MFDNQQSSQRRIQQSTQSIIQQACFVAYPYWFSSEKWRARGLLLLVIFLSVSSSTFLVLESLQRGELISALVSGSNQRFFLSLIHI